MLSGWTKPSGLRSNRLYLGFLVQARKFVARTFSFKRSGSSLTLWLSPNVLVAILPGAKKVSAMVLKTDEKHKLNSTIIRLEAKRKKTCTDTVFLGSEEPKTSKMKTSKMAIGHRLFICCLWRTRCLALKEK